MKHIDYTQLGGFPLEQNTLNFMQSAYGEFFNAMIAQWGCTSDKSYIITGCEYDGTTITKGWVVINNEILPFAGGEGDTIGILNTNEAVTFENGQSHEVYQTKTAVIDLTGILINDFIRLSSIVELSSLIGANFTALGKDLAELKKKTAVFQNGGGMVLWNKPAYQIPAGWREVVNWRGRIPVGLNPDDTDFDTIGKTGGAKTKQLTIAELPSHDHGVDADNFNRFKGLYFGGNTGFQTNIGSYRTAATGGDKPFSLMNPYRVVLFIEYID